MAAAILTNQIGNVSGYDIFKNLNTITGEIAYSSKKAANVVYIPTVNIDVNTGQVYLPSNFDTGISEGNGPGVPLIKYANWLDYTKKNFATKSDALGVNNWSASYSGSPIVKYNTVPSVDLSWMPTFGTIIYKDGKIQSVNSSPFVEITVNKALI